MPFYVSALHSDRFGLSFIQELLEKKAWEVAVAPIQSVWALKTRTSHNRLAYLNLLCTLRAVFHAKLVLGRHEFLLSVDERVLPKRLDGQCMSVSSDQVIKYVFGKNSTVAVRSCQVFSRNLHNHDFGANLSVILAPCAVLTRETCARQDLTHSCQVLPHLYSWSVRQSQCSFPKLQDH